MLWNLIRADFIKVKHNNWLWLLIFGTTLFANIMLFNLGGEDDGRVKIQIFYFVMLSFCFPLCVAIISGMIHRVDDRNMVLLYSKPHRVRYFFSKICLLATLSLLSLLLLAVGFILPFYLKGDMEAVKGLTASLAVYYLLLSLTFPLFTVLSVLIKSNLATVFIVLGLYFFYPFFSNHIAPSFIDNPVMKSFVQFDKKYGSLLPQNIYDVEFYRVAFPNYNTLGRNDPMLFGYPTYWENVPKILLSGESKALYAGIFYFFLLTGIGCIGMKRRRIDSSI